MSERAPKNKSAAPVPPEVAEEGGPVMNRRQFGEGARKLGGALLAAYFGFDPVEVQARAPRLAERRGTIEAHKLPLKELVGKLYEGAWQGPRADEKNPQDSEYFDKRVQGWKEHYLKNKKDRARLKAGLQRLLANNGAHLRMIYEIAQEKTDAQHRSQGRKRALGETLPFDVVFLALAESHWNAFGENGAQAAGYWQFIRGAARDYKLANVSAKGDAKARYTRAELEALGDERLDPRASTIAGVTYLIELKRRYKSRGGVKVGDDDALSYAMWAYNRGPGHVDKTFSTTEGNAVRYSRTLIQGGDTRSRRESANYVPKIMGIRLAAKELFEEILGETVAVPAPGAIVAAKESAPAVEHKSVPAPKPAPEAPAEATKTTNSEADQAYEILPDIVEELGARGEKGSLLPRERERVQDYLAELERIRKLYTAERRKGVHTEGYARAAIEIINEKALAVQRAFPSLFTVESGAAKTGIDEETGDLKVEVKPKEGGPAVAGEVIDFRVRSGDSLGKIAVWLTGDRTGDGATGQTLKLIFALNPHLKDRKGATIFIGEKIKVPAKSVVIKRDGQGKLNFNTLGEVANAHYKKWTHTGKLAAIKYINGKRTDTIREGERLYVPIQ